MRDVWIVGDRFAGFARLNGVATVSGVAEVLNGEKVTLHLGQGIGEYERDHIRSVVAQRDLADRVVMVDTTPAPAGRAAVHKHLAANVLLGDVRATGPDTISASLRLSGENELLLDHQTGLHVQGMVVVEAARQLLLAAYEELCGHPDSYVVLHALQLSFESFLFPLPAQLSCQLEPVAPNQRGAAYIQVEQDGRRIATARVRFTGYDADRIGPIERGRAESAVMAATSGRVTGAVPAASGRAAPGNGHVQVRSEAGNGHARVGSEAGSGRAGSEAGAGSVVAVRAAVPGPGARAWRRRGAGRPAPRVRPIAFFDVDGTLVAGKTMREFLGFRIGAAEAEAQWRRLVAGGAQREAVNRDYFALYAGTRWTDLMAAGREWYASWSRRPDGYVAGGLHALRHHRSAGHEIVLVSGSFLPCLRPLAEHLGVHEVLCTEPELDAGGVLTGAAQPLIGRAKAVAAHRFIVDRRVPAGDCFGYGDHSSDLDLLTAVGRPVVVGDDPELIREAGRYGWPRLSGEAVPATGPCFCGCAVAAWSMSIPEVHGA